MVEPKALAQRILRLPECPVTGAVRGWVEGISGTRGERGVHPGGLLMTMVLMKMILLADQRSIDLSGMEWNGRRMMFVLGIKGTKAEVHSPLIGANPLVDFPGEMEGKVDMACDDRECCA
jgi:hypothetical protein